MHSTEIVAAVLGAETGQLQAFAMGGESAKVAGFCAGFPRPVRVAYEAGPAGYGLARELSKRGVECVVAGPSKIPRASGDRVRTDRRDAEHLVRLLLAGKRHAVRVPGDEEEALRDLVRAREAVRMDLMRCRHRLSRLLLRHGIRFDHGQAWTERHRDWLGTVALDWPAAEATLLDARGAVDALCHRREQLEREIVALLPASPWVVQVARLRCLRGVDTLSAVGLCAEIGDFERFRPRRAADELRGPGPVGVNDRAAAPAWVDHQDRVGARAAAAGRGRMALPLAPEHRPRAHRPPGQPAAGSDRGFLVSPAAAVPHLDTPGGPRETPHDHRGRGRSANSPGSAGRSPESSNHQPNITYPVGWVGGGPATRGEPAS